MTFRPFLVANLPPESGLPFTFGDVGRFAGKRTLLVPQNDIGNLTDAAL
jgi:hypothetical protein